MTKSRLITAVVAVVVIAVAWIPWRGRGDDGPAYRFATAERGDLEATVSATGNLSAVTSVQVGTQVSGQVSAIYADFNDEVKKGQLLARIDPTLQQQAVQEAQAGLNRVEHGDTAGGSVDCRRVLGGGGCVLRLLPGAKGRVAQPSRGTAVRAGG
jgi:multidrug efflux pump subunit AcrA (membrane-fusion protein)